MTNKKLCLFVCMGNTCRSPMAEALFRHRYGDEYDSKSAGIAPSGGRINPKSVKALEAAGISPSKDNDYKSRVSRPADENAIASADITVALDYSVYLFLITRYPEYRDKITHFDPPVADPYGGDDADYERALFEIDRGLPEIIEKLK